jgi:hypothetical protein
MRNQRPSYVLKRPTYVSSMTRFGVASSSGLLLMPHRRRRGGSSHGTRSGIDAVHAICYPRRGTCGSCGRSFTPTGRDYLGCPAAHDGSCRNVSTVRRLSLEAQVMELLHRQLMQPDILADFLGSLRDEYERLYSEMQAKAAAGQRERAALDRKIAKSG